MKKENTTKKAGRQSKESPENMYPNVTDLRPTDGNFVCYMDTLLFDYTRKVFPIIYSQKKEAIRLFRFIVSEILGWEPEDVPLHMNDEIMHRFQLDEYAAYITGRDDVPVAIKTNQKYIFSFVYPDIVKYRYRDRYSDFANKAAKWGKLELSSFNLGDGDDVWFGYFPDFLAENFNISSTERLYYIFSDGPEMKKKIESGHLAPLLKLCYHPVQILDAYLTKIDRDCAMYANYDTDLEEDPLCYFAAMLRSVVTQYGKRVRKYRELISDGGTVDE